MESRIKPTDLRIEQFWDRYLDLIQMFRVPGKAAPWYRQHVQAFIDGHPGIRLREQRPENLQHWFERAGRNAQLPDWQYRQKVDALRLLFCHLLKVPWAANFDWEYWSANAQSLGNDHPTVARTYDQNRSRASGAR